MKKMIVALGLTSILFISKTTSASEFVDFITDTYSQKLQSNTTQLNYNLARSFKRQASVSDCFSPSSEVDTKTQNQSSKESGKATLSINLTDANLGLYKMQVTDRLSNKLSEFYILNISQVSKMAGRYLYAPVYLYSGSKGLIGVTNQFRHPCSSCSGEFKATSTLISDSDMSRLGFSIAENTTRCGRTESKKESISLQLN